MTDFQRGILSLIKSALCGDIAQLPSEFDWKRTVDLGIKHQILAVIYYGVCNSKIECPPEEKSIMETAVFQNILLDQNQQYQLKKIYEAFEKNHIDYMPLKGSVLKYVYPKSEMRPMGDADILIKYDQYDEIKPLLIELGFEEKYESPHELVWKKNKSLNLELHKFIIPPYNKDFESYFGNGWRLAKKATESGYKYEMSPEDELIYNFTHMASHYRDGGIGIRHMLDIYICLPENHTLDYSYIEGELKKIGLYKFFCNVLDTVNVWFRGGQANDITDLITDFVFSSGSYGTMESKAIASAVKTSKSTKNSKKVHGKRLMKLIFKPFNEMKGKYPILERIPILLPVMWVVRWVTAILFERDDIKFFSGELKHMTAENIDSFQDQLEFVGLDFNFKE